MAEEVVRLYDILMNAANSNDGSIVLVDHIEADSNITNVKDLLYSLYIKICTDYAGTIGNGAAVFMGGLTMLYNNSVQWGGPYIMHIDSDNYQKCEGIWFRYGEGEIYHFNCRHYDDNNGYDKIWYVNIGTSLGDGYTVTNSHDDHLTYTRGT